MRRDLSRFRRNHPHQSTIDRPAGRRKRLTGRIGELDTRLSGRIDKLDARLSGRIGELDASLSGRIDNVEVRLGAIEQQMATKSDLAALAAHMERQLRVMAGVIVAGLAAIVGTAEAAIRFL